MLDNVLEPEGRAARKGGGVRDPSRPGESKTAWDTHCQIEGVREIRDERKESGWRSWSYLLKTDSARADP